MNYEKFTYLWPPRPTTTIKPFSEHYDKMKARDGWIGEIKLNGQRNVIYISPDREVQFWNRHQEHHKNWECPEWLREQLLHAIKPTDKWIVLDGELMHSKDAQARKEGIINTFYIWDALVYDSKFLMGKTYRDRSAILHKAMIDPEEEANEVATRVTPNVWMSQPLLPTQWDAAWQLTEKSWVEGFVFKNSLGKLKPCIRQKNNDQWMVRCRKATGRHAF